jgi:hypothetical protein
MGPLAPENTSLGLMYQVWKLTWDFATDNFIITPEITLTPVIVLNHADVTQCSLAFDQNAHVSIAFTAGGQAKLYWYDSVPADWVTTNLPFGATTPMLALDDKRTTQTLANDVLLYYTIKQLDDTYNLYQRRQRDRYLTEYLQLTGAPPYIYKQGMQNTLRIQLGLSTDII